MLRRKGIVLFALAACCCAGISGTFAGRGTAEGGDAGRLVVVSTYPANGAADVDPALKEIRVRFSGPVARGSYSFVNADAAAGAPPEIAGTPRLAEGDTV